MALQQALDGEQSFFDALRVVEAVDPYADERVGREAQLREHVGTALGRRGDRLQPMGGPLDRDGIWPHQGPLLAVDHGIVLAVDARLQEAVDRVEEVVAVELGVEAQNAAAEQPRQQLVAPGADPELL